MTCTSSTVLPAQRLRIACSSSTRFCAGRPAPPRSRWMESGQGAPLLALGAGPDLRGLPRQCALLHGPRMRYLRGRNFWTVLGAAYGHHQACGSDAQLIPRSLPAMSGRAVEQAFGAARARRLSFHFIYGTIAAAARPRACWARCAQTAPTRKCVASPAACCNPSPRQRQWLHSPASLPQRLSRHGAALAGSTRTHASRQERPGNAFPGLRRVEGLRKLAATGRSARAFKPHHLSPSTKRR